MSKIKNFENLNTYEKSISIINFFNQLTQKKEFKLFINNIEDIIKLEKKEILFFFNKIFINNFDYNNNNFKKKISYSNIVKYFFIFNGLLLSKFFFKKKINISKNIKIILKQVDNNEQLYSKIQKK